MPSPEDIELGSIGENPPEGDADNNPPSSPPPASEVAPLAPPHTMGIARLRVPHTPEGAPLVVRPSVPRAAAPQRRITRQTCGRIFRNLVRLMLVAVVTPLFAENIHTPLGQLMASHNNGNGILGVVCRNYTTYNMVAQVACKVFALVVLLFNVLLATVLPILLFSRSFGQSVLNCLSAMQGEDGPSEGPEEPDYPGWEESPLSGLGAPPPYWGSPPPPPDSPGRAHWQEPPMSSAPQPDPDGDPPPYSEEPPMSSAPQPDPDGDPPRPHLWSRLTATPRTGTRNGKKPVYRTLFAYYWKLLCNNLILLVIIFAILAYISEELSINKYA